MISSFNVYFLSERANKHAFKHNNLRKNKMNSSMTNNKKENSLAKNIIRVLTANFWVAVIGFIGSFIFPRILTIDAYALYQTFTLYLGYIAIVHLGFPSGMVINYAGKDYDTIDRKQYRSEILLLLGILSFFTLVFFVIATITNNAMLMYIALAIIPTGIIGSYKSLLQAWSRFKAFSRMSTFLATTVPLIALSYFLVTNTLSGNVYILIYLGVYWIITIAILVVVYKKIHGVRANKLLSEVNFKTERIGLALMLGNYINTLFVSSDKQFIKWFFGNLEFAYYSFGMSMQSLMTVVIVSIAQPLFPAMAQGKLKDEEYDSIKEILLIFGSLSGCAYFIVSIIVKLFIQKYTNSLDVVGIYFVIFPAMAVINCLYINLYKIKGMMKTYIKTLAGILTLAIALNTIFVFFVKEFTGVAIATTITYYVWLLIGFKQFEFLHFTIKDLIYIIIYMIGFFIITKNVNDYIGIIVYASFVAILSIMCYKNELLLYVDKLFHR